MKNKNIIFIAFQIAVLISHYLLTYVSASRAVGEYSIFLNKLESCEDEGTGQISWGHRLSHLGMGNHVSNDTIYIGVPLDEHSVVKLDVQSMGNGGYKRFAVHISKGCKEHFKWFGETIRNILSYSFAEKNKTIDECPIPTGNYTIEGWNLLVDFNSVAIKIPYNKYRGFMSFYHDRTKIGCQVLYGEAVPKRSTI